MSEEIKNALSAEEWAQMAYGDGAVLVKFDLAGEVVLWFEGPLSLGWPHKLVAASNAALPDTDPRKIRREDVARLREGASHMTEEGWRGDDERDFVIALAAKLTALLPPESA